MGYPPYPTDQKDIVKKLIYKSTHWVLKLILLSRPYYTLNLDDQINPSILVIHLKSMLPIVLGNRISTAWVTYSLHSNY